MEFNFEWNDEYSIGVDEIDVQHKGFLKLIKRTYEFAGETVDNKEVLKLLDELMKYATFHFGSEELLMKTYSYPQYMEQKNEHDKIMKELDEKIVELKAHKEGMNNLLFFLMKWFVDHDNYFDKKFGEYVNNYRTNIYTKRHN